MTQIESLSLRKGMDVRERKIKVRRSDAKFFTLNAGLATACGALFNHAVAHEKERTHFPADIFETAASFGDVKVQKNRLKKKKKNPFKISSTVVVPEQHFLCFAKLTIVIFRYVNIVSKNTRGGADSVGHFTAVLFCFDGFFLPP